MAVKTANTQRELAAALGRSPGTVSRWLKEDRWPFGQSGPWAVAKVRVWVDSTLAEDPAAADPRTAVDAAASVASLSHERRAKLSVLVEHAAALRIAREIKLGVYHRTDECDPRRGQQIREVRDALLELGRELAPRLEGLTRAEIETAIRARAVEICNAFAAKRTGP